MKILKKIIIAAVILFILTKLGIIKIDVGEIEEYEEYEE